MKNRIIRRAILLPTIVAMIICCSRPNQIWNKMDLAENLLETRPDSALTIMSSIEKEVFWKNEEKARYSLLLSMALDMNCIDTTSFEILQPAIDYYLKNGNANDKLRTYYCQGRIFQNQGDRYNALNSFIKGIDIASESNDSLCIARTLATQGGLYDESYDFESSTNCHLRAAKIYKDLSLRRNEFDCLLNALNGTIASGNKTKGDSILSLCNEFMDLDNTQKLSLIKHRLSHALKFNDIATIKKLIGYIENQSNLDTEDLLNLALAYNKTGNNFKARNLLEYINDGHNYDTLRYLAISVPVLENTGDYKGALTAYRYFSHTMDSINTFRFDQKAQSVEDEHKLELKAQQDAKVKAKIIGGCVGGIVFLIMVVIILLLLFRNSNSKKKLAIERAKTSELENKQLKSDNEMALQRAKITELENDRLKSERDKKALELENLAHRVKMLENESSSLRELIDSQEELPPNVQQAIKVRIEMLNALMASYITDNEQYEKPYELWIKELTNNTEEFMNSNRLAFQASHPHFIQYFEEHGLTVSELNYVCLYAIGLKGKEVGNYMKKRSHVNISSGIRKKLGIDKHETNIGIYVRKLLKEL